MQFENLDQYYAHCTNLVKSIRFDHDGYVDRNNRRCWLSDDKKIVAGSAWCDGPQQQFFWISSSSGSQTLIEERISCSSPMTPDEIISTFYQLIEARQW